MPMPRRLAARPRHIAVSIVLLCLFTLAACGDGGGGHETPNHWDEMNWDEGRWE